MITTGDVMVRNLKKLREEKGISQRVLGELVGVCQQAINKYENHGSEPSVDVLIALADYFNTSVDYLIGYSDVNRKNENYRPKDLNDEEQQVIDSYRKLTKKERESIQLILDNYLK